MALTAIRQAKESEPHVPFNGDSMSFPLQRRLENRPGGVFGIGQRAVFRALVMVNMLHLATWMRERDEPLFHRFLAAHPAIRVHNARTEPADVREAHGLLVTGGPDLSASFHVEPPRDPSLIEEPEPERDAWEMEAILAALERGLPMFCICKGVQVLNVALGGTLHLDIPGHDLPEQRSSNVQQLRHADSARHRIEWVNSSHHQALDRVAADLEVEAWSVADGVIEQVRLRHFPFCFGVQYHPERDSLYAPLFEDFFSHLNHGRRSPPARTES